MAAVRLCPYVLNSESKKKPTKSEKARTCGSENVIKKGFFRRLCDSKRIQRSLCRDCGHTFSSQTTDSTYRLQRNTFNHPLECLLVSGVSQRRCALFFQLSRKTVALRIVRFAQEAREMQQKFLVWLGPRRHFHFDVPIPVNVGGGSDRRWGEIPMQLGEPSAQPLPSHRFFSDRAFVS